MAEIEGIKYTGPILDNSGYAKACRENILALYKLGVPLTLNPISFEKAKPDLGENGKIIKSLINRQIDYNINIIHTTPEFWSRYRESNKINCGYTIWEATKLHPDWVPYINNNVDGCMVGCEWNIEVFKDSGVTVPLFNVPHVVDVADQDKVDPFIISGVDPKAYKFYSIFQWTERKNPLALIKSYWSAFTKEENVALILKTYRSDYSDSEKDAIRTTIRRLKRVCPSDNYPPIYLVLDMLSEEEMIGLHTSGDCYVSLDRGEGFGLCVSRHTKITTEAGTVTADKVVEGDKVLGIDGGYHKISLKTSRVVEKALKIRAKLHGEELVISHEHPFYVTTLTRQERYNLSKEDIEKTLSWKRADELKLGDYLAIPKPILNKDLPDRIDITEYTNIYKDNLLFKDDRVSCKFGYSPKDIEQSYKTLVHNHGYTKKIFERAVGHLKNLTFPLKGSKTEEALNILSSIGYEVKEPNYINQYIDINDELLTLFGWYIAEGSTNNSTFLEIDLHSKEYGIAIELSEIFKKYFNVSESSILVEKKENKSRLIVSNKIIATFFSNVFGSGAYNKRIPTWLYFTGKKIMPLLRSLFEGDGYDDRYTYALTTVSPTLAYQVKHILNSMGYCPYIKVQSADKRIGNYDAYTIGMSGEGRSKLIREPSASNYVKNYVETNNFILVRVTSINEVIYDDLMYDFSVENVHSFVGNGILMHNCPAQAGAMGKPIIVTGFGGTTEYAKPDNSYLCDFVEIPVFGKTYALHNSNIMSKSSNSGKPQIGNAVGNPERSLEKGTCND